MAITNGYATLAEYKAYASIDSTDATDDGVIEDLIESASRYIDAQTGRTFYARTETRYFSVPGSRELRFDDDLLTITTLTNGNGTTIASTEYYFLPRNVSPKYALKLKEGSSTAWYPDSDSNYEYVISIAGTWGYTATRPDDISAACMEITKASYGRRKGQNMQGVARVTAAGVVITPQDIPASAMAIIKRYRKYN
jgi:hypothetical protein